MTVYGIQEGAFAHFILFLVSEGKVLSHPATADSIPTSGGFEDHVSMGGFSARKAVKVVENAEKGELILNKS